MATKKEASLHSNLTQEPGEQVKLPPAFTAREAHFLETGHPMAFGCCEAPDNLCKGCGELLPRPARTQRFEYCSRACKEAANG